MRPASTRVYGARPLRRAIQTELENPLSQQILSGEFGPGDTISVDVSDGALVFARGAEGAASAA